MLTYRYVDTDVYASWGDSVTHKTNNIMSQTAKLNTNMFLTNNYSKSIPETKKTGLIFLSEINAEVDIWHVIHVSGFEYVESFDETNTAGSQKHHSKAPCL